MIDGMALVCGIGRPEKARTFGDSADAFCKKVFSLATHHCASRMDVVFDRYNELSIKFTTRQKRTSKSQMSVKKLVQSRSTPLHFITFILNIKAFLSLWNTKTSLQAFLSQQLLIDAKDKRFETVIGGGFAEMTTTISSVKGNVFALQSRHEEADTRILLHGIEASKNVCERTIVICRDTDVFLLLLFAEILTFWYYCYTISEN